MIKPEKPKPTQAQIDAMRWQFNHAFYNRFRREIDIKVNGKVLTSDYGTAISR